MSSKIVVNLHVDSCECEWANDKKKSTNNNISSFTVWTGIANIEEDNNNNNKHTRNTQFMDINELCGRTE